VLRGPLVGEVGLIVNLKGSVTFPGGLRSRAAEVRFEDGNTKFVPLANLEVII
jgi:hypothetical protein